MTTALRRDLRIAVRAEAAACGGFAYLTASRFLRLPLSFRPLTQSCERHMALLAQAIIFDGPREVS